MLENSKTSVEGKNYHAKNNGLSLPAALRAPDRANPSNDFPSSELWREQWTSITCSEKQSCALRVEKGGGCAPRRQRIKQRNDAD